MIDVRRLKVGDLLIKILVHYAFTSIPGSRSVVISDPVTRQRRQLERTQVSNSVAGSRPRDNFTECIAKNASGITMRMNEP